MRSCFLSNLEINMFMLIIPCLCCLGTFLFSFIHVCLYFIMGCEERTMCSTVQSKIIRSKVMLIIIRPILLAFQCINIGPLGNGWDVWNALMSADECWLSFEWKPLAQAFCASWTMSLKLNYEVIVLSSQTFTQCRCFQHETVSAEVILSVLLHGSHACESKSR